MALARVYSAAAGGIQTTLDGAYRDRLAKESDIAEHLPMLYEAAAAYPGCRVIELGTRTGNSTLAFLAAAEQAAGHVWSADISPCDRDPLGMGPWAACPLWTFTCGDDLDHAVLAALPAQCDVLFVDTSHFYDHTVAELAAYMPRVVPGGTALFHDTNLLVAEPGRPASAKYPPVRQALNEWCKADGTTWDDLGGGYGLGRIRVG